MEIYRLRNKRNKKLFYSSKRKGRTFFARLHHLKMALKYDPAYDPERWDLVEYEVKEKAVFPSPRPDELVALTREDIQKIRKKVATGDFTAKEAAYEYGVHPATVRRAINRETWHED